LGKPYRGDSTASRGRTMDNVIAITKYGQELRHFERDLIRLKGVPLDVSPDKRHILNLITSLLSWPNVSASDKSFAVRLIYEHAGQKENFKKVSQA